MRPRSDPVVLVALASAGLLLALFFGPVIGDRFGESRDGHNGAVWATTARALRDDGIVRSRLGADVGEGAIYANHPPLITLETAAVELAVGERGWATRAPAWAGTVGALLLLWRLLGELALSARSRAVGILFGVGCPMLLAFGSMLDTPVTSLPFGLAALLVWIRPATGRTWWARAATSLLATVAGWQAGLLVALTIAVDLVQRRPRQAAPAATGLAVGLAAVLGWQLWVYGSLSNVVDQLRFRTTIDDGGYDVSITGSMVRQAEWLAELLTPVAIVTAFVGLALLLRAGGPRREVATVGLGTVVVYTTVLSGGANFHEYWSYWSVVLVIVGTAACAERLEAFVSEGRVARWWADVVPVGLGLALAATSLWRQPEPLEIQEQGLDAIRIVATIEGPEVAVYGLVPSVAPWITYETGQAVDYLTTSELRELTRAASQRPVLTSCRVVELARARCDDTFIVLPASELGDLLVG